MTIFKSVPSFSPCLTGEIYVDFLENELSALLENVYLREREELVCQYNGVSAFFDYSIRITPKYLVEHICGNFTEAEMWEAIRAAFFFSTITLEIAHRATRNIIRKAEICLQEWGRTSNNSCIKMQKWIGPTGIRFLKNAPYCLLQNGMEIIALYQFFATK